jgi:RNA polymerase II subunit A small phosphatase-like protein
MARINEWGYYDMDSSGYYEYTKKLHKLKRKGYKLEQILIVDDTPAKLAFNYGNAIHIKPFTGSPIDSELLRLMQYLPTLKDIPNVRSIEKRGWWNNF